MTDASGAGVLLALDPDRGAWLREDALAADALARAEDGLYLLTGGRVYRMGGGDDERVEWMAEFVPFRQSPFARCGDSRILVAMDLAPGASARAEVRRDGGLWRTAWAGNARRQTCYSIPLPMGRCSRFQLRLSGQGGVIIRALAREYTEGSDHGTSD